MKTADTKSLLKFTFGLMEKLDNQAIDVENAKAQANLIKQANNLLRYELDRSKTLMKIKQHNDIYQDNVQLREIESK